MKKLKLLMLFVCTLIVWQVKGQTGSDCFSALSIAQTYSNTFAGNANEQWYKFTATSNTLLLNVVEKSNQVNISKIEVYAGICETKTLLAKDSLTNSADSTKTIILSNLTINSTYYVRVSFINYKLLNYYTLDMKPAAALADLIWTGPDGTTVCGNSFPLTCQMTICLGESLCFKYHFQYNLPGGPTWDTFTFTGGYPNLLVPNTFDNNAPCAVFTPTAAGTYTASGGIIVPFLITVLPSTPPSLSYSVSPSNPMCLGSCITLTSLTNPSSIVSYSFNAPGTAMIGFPTPCLQYTASGNHTIDYILNANHTCSVVANYTAVVLDPSVSFSINNANCTLDRTFTAFDNCNSSSLFSTTYNWNIYNGTSNTGTLVYSSSFANNILSYTFPSSGTYYVEVQSSLGGVSGQIINVLPATPPVINITSTSINLCDVKYAHGSNFITLNPNVTMGTGDIATWTATDAVTLASLTMPYTIGANGIINYYMNAFLNYPNPITFCVDLTVNGCENKQCFTLYPCCPTPSGTIVYSNKIFTSNTTLNATSKYRFSGTITINPSVQLYLKYVDVSFDPNTKIIILGNNAQLKSDHSYLHGCSAMWDGIYLYNGSRIDLTETTIEDAKRAVVDTLGAADIAIDYSWFNKNYESIILKAPNTNSALNLDNNYFTDDHIPSAYTTVPIYIDTVAPSVISAYSRAHLLAPYNGVTIKPYSGVTLYRTKTTANTNQYVEIGDDNIFDKLHYGVVASLSKVWVRKNTFLNMDARGDIGVFVSGASTGLQNVTNPSDVKVGGNIPQANNFNTCYTGVSCSYATAITVRNNNFIFSNTAIAVNANNRNKLATIDRNKINATQIGIQFYNNISLNAQITENTLINNIPVGIYNSNTGINVSEVVTTSYTKYNVYNNKVSGYFNGIYTTHTYSVQINDNEVHLTPTTISGQDQYGIRIENNTIPWVMNNTIDKPSADYNAVWQNGIYAGTNTTPILLCNQITNMGTSLKFDGPNTTITGLGIINNTMSFGKYGIWLNNSAEIGNQSTFGIFGNPNGTSNNQWIGFSSAGSPPTWQTYVSGGSNVVAGGSVMYTKGPIPLSNTYCLRNANAGGIISGGGHYLLGDYTYPFSQLTCNATNVTPLRMQNANKIATNTMGFTGNAANLYAISKRQLLHHIKLNNLNVNADVVLKAFMDSAYTTHLGQFYQVDSLMLKAITTGSASVLNTARSLNNSIANTGNIVYNKQTLNNTYMNMLSAEPDSLTLANLRDLAVKCPNLEGDAVFQARSILMYYDKQMYTSFCESDFTTTTNHRLGNTDNAVAPEEPKELMVYPNPTNRDITIEYTKGDDNEAAELIVFNQLGELVLTKLLIDNKTSLSLEQLNSGIYFYTIRQQGVVLKTSKLVITK